MSFASANRTELHRVKETNWGVTPANPVWTPFRYTGEQIDDNISTEKSKEIRADRMVTDLHVVDSSPGGSVNIELAYAAYHDLFESLMMSTWSSPLAIVGVAADISTLAQAADNLTSGTADKFQNVVVGQWVRLSGFTDAVNGFYRVSAKADNQTLTLVPQPAAAETPAGTDAKVDGSYVRNGTTEQSYSILKIFNDATTVTRQVFRGMRVKSLSAEMQTASLLTGSFNFMGKSGEWTETAIAGETFGTANTNEVMNAVTNMQNIVQDDATIGTTGSVMSMSLEVDNQHREQKGLGVLGNVGISAGQFMAQVSAQQYFESKDQADKFKAATAFSFSFRLRGNDGATYIITLPRCKYTSFVVNSSQLDSDVMADTQFEALRDPTTNCMMQIDRFDALA